MSVRAQANCRDQKNTKKKYKIIGESFLLLRGCGFNATREKYPPKICWVMYVRVGLSLPRGYGVEKEREQKKTKPGKEEKNSYGIKNNANFTRCVRCVLVSDGYTPRSK